MRFTFFSAATYLQYLFEGFLISAVADIWLNEARFFVHLLGYGADGSAQTAAEVVVFMAVIIFFIVGHANSTLAHLILQQGLASVPFLRPSRFFISEALNHGESEPTGFLRMWIWVRNLVWKPFNIRDRERLNAWLAAHPEIDGVKDDRCIFGEGFGRVNSSSASEVFEVILLNFNFSRNMLTTLLVCGLIASIGAVFYDASIENNAKLLKLCDPAVDCDEYNTTAIMVLYFLTVGLLILRFFFFFGVVSKNVIRHLIETDAGGSAAEQSGAITSDDHSAGAAS